MIQDMLMDYRAALQALKDAGREAEFAPGSSVSGGFSSVVIDSRKAEAGSLFAAIKGEESDGHRYLRSAFENGAVCALVTRAGLKENGLSAEDFLAGFQGGGGVSGRALFVVDDSLSALQNLAAAYLDRFPKLLRIGITGSVGKTTTKEIAAAIIGREKKVVTNQGNLNSETGLPLAVFGVRSDHEAGIFEAGMNKLGEIAGLAAVLRPHVALVTTIGPSHIGFIGSLEGIAQEKKRIFSRFTGTETALIPEEDAFADFLSAGIQGRVVRYGQRSLEASGTLGAIHDRGLAGTEIVWEGVPAVFGLPGRHHVKNIIAAAAIAREIGVSVSGEAMREALSSVKCLFGRGELLRGKTTVFRDCYNANPISVPEAIGICDNIEWNGRRVYILGTMLELGSYSGEAHRTMGKQLAASKADMVFLYGKEKETESAVDVLAENNIPHFYATDMTDLKKAVSGYIRPGDFVLLKGSRGCALEELSDTVCMKEGGE
jgi:UDP-N-acetylmuramoyl-tripeptide--D-alanyl-D-alanine ligase